MTGFHRLRAVHWPSAEFPHRAGAASHVYRRQPRGTLREASDSNEPMVCPTSGPTSSQPAARFISPPQETSHAFNASMVGGLLFDGGNNRSPCHRYLCYCSPVDQSRLTTGECGHTPLPLKLLGIAMQRRPGTVHPSPLAQRYASTDYRRQPCVAGSAFAVNYRDLVAEAGLEPATFGL